MNKTELVAAVAAKAELSKKDADAAVSAVVDARWRQSISRRFRYIRS